jgi:HTH-type transcriptional regulator / antitoxin HigA
MEQAHAQKQKKVNMLHSNTIKHWNKLQDSLGGILKPIENETHYDQLAILLDELLEETRGEPKHPLRGMLEVVTRLIQEFDTAHPITLSSPLEMLAWYMERDGLTQTELAAKTGLDQSLISKHLQGKRAINLAHARGYAKAFGVTLEAFIR